MEDHNKFRRLLEMLMYLSCGIKRTIGEIAERFGISERSAHRYIQTFRNAGFVYYDGPALLQTLKPGIPIRLQREPANPYDPRAVEVYCGTAKLGYLPRSNNPVIASLMDQHFGLQAEINEVCSDKDHYRPVGIEIFALQPVTEQPCVSG